MDKGNTIIKYKTRWITLILLVVLFFLYLFKTDNSPTSVKPLINLTAIERILPPDLTKHNSLFNNKQTVEIFVSPFGNDSAIGDLKNPLRTPEKAQMLLRKIQSYNKAIEKKYIVTFLEGTYYFDKPLIMSAADSGSVNNPVVYRAEKNKEVIFSGEKLIDSKFVQRASDNLPGWDRIQNEVKSKVYQVNLKETGIKDFGSIALGGYDKSFSSPMELYINDTAMELARWPNKRYAVFTNKKQDSLTFWCKQIKDRNWKNEKEIWAKGFWKHAWAEFNLPVKDVDTQTGKIVLSIADKRYGMGERGQWFAFNVLSELDTALEYYIDRETGWMYFIAPDNININNTKISVSMFDGNTSLIVIDSSKYIAIEGISFKGLRSSALIIKKSEYITIENCSVSNVGSFAINLNGTNCTIKNTHISNAGAYGIEVSGGDRKTLTRANNSIENCKIHNLGRINYTCSSYGVSLFGVGHTIKNCEIYDLPHKAIAFDGNYHTIEKNKIHNVCNEVDDAGAVYCGRDWGLYGNVIRHNFIYNIIGSPYKKHHKRMGIHAIYLDDYASGIIVFGNVIYNVSNSGIVNSGGRNNIIENNVIIKCKYAHRVFYGPHLAKHKKEMYARLNSFNYKELPWVDAFPQLTDMSEYKSLFIDDLKLEHIQYKYPYLFNVFGITFSSDKNPEGCTFRNNIVYKCTSTFVNYKNEKENPYRFYYVSNNLVDINPQFVDEDKLNLNLLDTSPVYNKINCFVRIPFEQIGLR